VNRDDIREGADDLGVDFDEHLTIVIAALTEHRDELMPAGEAASDGAQAPSAGGGAEA
jgi:hypothetical protein